MTSKDIEARICDKIYKHFNTSPNNEIIPYTTIFSTVAKKSAQLKNRALIGGTVADIIAEIKANLSISPILGYSENFPERQRDSELSEFQRNGGLHTLIYVIDSKDRDAKTYSAPNCFTIEFPKSFADIRMVEVVGCVIADDPCVRKPYLLLVLEELGSSCDGSNVEVSKAFGILRDYVVLDGYRHYKMNSTMTKEFVAPVGLMRLTIKLKSPDGSICLFDEAHDSGSSRDTVIQLMLKITYGK